MSSERGVRITVVPLKGLFITESQTVTGENKIIGRSHSPFVKSRHKLKGMWGKQASEIWKGHSSCQVMVAWEWEEPEVLPQQPRTRWHLRCPAGKELGFRTNVYIQVYRERLVFWWSCSFWSSPGRLGSQHSSILPYSGVMNTTICPVSCELKHKDRLPVAWRNWDERLGPWGHNSWRHWNQGPWVEFRGSINLDRKIILFPFHCCPAGIEHFVPLWMSWAPGVIAGSMTLPPREITGSFKPQDSWDRYLKMPKS